jgi:iron complex transport system ATP-binding protein
MHPEPASLRIEGVGVRIDGVDIVQAAMLSAAPGHMVGLVGPNGSGKSTILRTVYRVLRPRTGAVLVSGQDAWALSAKEAARRTAVVAQESSSDFDLSVRDVVEMGRTPHKRLLERDTPTDHAIVDEALSRVRMTAFADRAFGTLSGGEKQRVLVARSLAQRSSLLVLDEPTNHLDVRAQFELLDLVRGLGVTTIAALHDLNLAARYCDHVFVMDRGRIVTDGPPAAVFTPELLAVVFGVIAECHEDAPDGRIHLRLLGASGRSASDGGAA